ETIAESMIARIPELSLRLMSDRLNPRRLSISSWFRMRSAPPLAACTNWLPSSIMAAHWAAISSLPSAGGAPGMGAGAPSASASRARPHSAASASWSTSALEAIGARPWFGARPPRARAAMAPASSLDQQLLEQDGVDARRLDRRVDAPGQLLLEPV